MTRLALMGSSFRNIVLNGATFMITGRDLLSGSEIKKNPSKCYFKIGQVKLVGSYFRLHQPDSFVIDNNSVSNNDFRSFRNSQPKGGGG